jgi:hypothetical protein
MEPQVTETEFTCKLITIRSKKSFADVTSALEGQFRMVDLPKLASMTEAGDQAGIKAYFQEISGDHEFSIFFKLDQGSTQRLAGFPLDIDLDEPTAFFSQFPEMKQSKVARHT